MALTIRTVCCECIFHRLAMHCKLIFHVINLIKRDVISIKKQWILIERQPKSHKSFQKSRKEHVIIYRTGPRRELQNEGNARGCVKIALRVSHSSRVTIFTHVRVFPSKKLLLNWNELRKIGAYF